MRGRRWTPRWCSPNRRGRPPLLGRLGRHIRLDRIRRGVLCCGQGGRGSRCRVVPGSRAAASWCWPRRGRRSRRGRACRPGGRCQMPRAPIRSRRRRRVSPRRVLDRARDELSGCCISPCTRCPTGCAPPAPWSPRRQTATAPSRCESCDDAAADAGPIRMPMLAPQRTQSQMAMATQVTTRVLRRCRLRARIRRGWLLVFGCRRWGRWWTRGCCSPRGCARSPRRPQELPAGIRVAVHDGMAGRIRARRAGGRASWPAWELRRIARASPWPSPPPDDPDAAKPIRMPAFGRGRPGG